LILEKLSIILFAHELRESLIGFSGLVDLDGDHPALRGIFSSGIDGEKFLNQLFVDSNKSTINGTIYGRSSLDTLNGTNALTLGDLRTDRGGLREFEENNLTESILSIIGDTKLSLTGLSIIIEPFVILAIET
jgi:hypothetical protein